MVKVTVITPTYNRATDYLTETIDSVLSQTYQNFEYLVLDDGSSDNTQELVDQYDDPRLKYLYHDNMGVVKTVNKGFQMATGEFVTVVNSDDPLLPNYLEEAVAFLEVNPDVMGVYPDWVMIDAESKPVREMHTKDYNFVESLSNYICFPGPGTLLRREIFDVIGFYDEKFKSIFDLEFYLRLGKYSYTLKRLPKVLAQYRHHPGTITNQSNAIAERLQMLDKLYVDMPSQFMQFKHKSYASVNYIAGLEVMENRRKASAYFLRSIFGYPFDSHPGGEPRRWGLMLHIMISSLLPQFIRHPLGKIKIRLEERST